MLKLGYLEAGCRFSLHKESVPLIDFPTVLATDNSLLSDPVVEVTLRPGNLCKVLRITGKIYGTKIRESWGIKTKNLLGNGMPGD